MSKEKKVKNSVVTEVDDWGRKKFHLQEGEEDQTPEAEVKAIEVGNTKSLLVAREEELDIDKYVGRIEKNKKDKTKEVFYCQVCKEGFKCDLAYITHLNSQQHNSKLGMSMKVRAVSTQEVSAKLASLKAKPDGVKRQHGGSKVQPMQGKSHHDDQGGQNEGEVKVEVKVEKQEEEEEQQNLQGNEQQDLDALLKACGLPSSFGSKKTKK